MKKLLLICLIMAAFQSFSQECGNYYFLQNNKTVEMTIYNQKGVADGKLVYSMSDVKTSGGVTTAQVQSVILDKKGKTIGKGISEMKCSGGRMMVNMQMMIPQSQTEMFKAADAKANNAFIEYPNSMSPGDELKNGSFRMEVDQNGVKQVLSMIVTDRKVQDRETITTTAGTWNCFKISYKNRMNIIMMGIPMPPINTEATEWFAPGFGIVKTESKFGTTAITSIK